MRVRSLCQEDPLEEGMATHSRILAWRIPWTEEPGGLQPWGYKESGMTEVTLHSQITLSISALLFSICWQCFQSKFQQDGKMTIEV